MNKAIELFLTQEANQVWIGNALEIGLQITAEEPPDERQTSYQPGMFGHAIDASG